MAECARVVGAKMKIKHMAFESNLGAPSALSYAKVLPYEECRNELT